MKKHILSIALGLGIMGAQAQDLPAPSPKTTLQQRVGLTDFTVEYSRPSAKEREIFGGLVPYDQVWRTGANKVTSISLSTPVQIQGETLEAGTYSLLTIPGEDQWIVIFNENTDLWGTAQYSEDQDVVRIEVPVEEAFFTETFTIHFDELRPESASLVLKWAETQVKVPIELEVKEQALANIRKAIEGAGDGESESWRVYRNAANYYYNNNLNNEQALKYIDQSLEANEKSWYSHWLKAQIQAKSDNYKAAVKSAQNAVERGNSEAREGGTEFTYEEMISEKIAEWKKKTSKKS